MRQLRYGEALAEAVSEVLEEDARITLIGAGFAGNTAAGAAFGPIYQKYADRIKWPPISELAYCGIAIGASMVGMRPIVAIGTAAFSYEAVPQIMNEAAIACSNSGGQTTAPVLFHMLHGVRGAGGVQHSGSPQPWYWNTPGLQVVEPGSPADVKGLFRWAALKSRNPTVFLDHQRIMDLSGPVPEGKYDIPFGQADVKRQGKDVTVVACGIQVPRALEAAEILAKEDGLDVEVVDPRTLEPLDKQTILASVAKTGRVVVTDESHDVCGVAAGLAAIIADEGFASLKAPIKRVSTMAVPVPYAQPMEDYVIASPQRIAQAVRVVARA